MKKKSELGRGIQSKCAFCVIRRLAVVSLLSLTFHATAQLVLTGTNYSQNFNAIGGGLPTGWTVRTGASAGGLGTVATLQTAATSWSSGTGQFANYASTVSDQSTNFLGGESIAAQAAATNRCLGVRQGGTFGGDPGAAFILQIADTVGISNLVLRLDMNLLSLQGRSTTWTVDYAVGNTPTAFTSLATYSDPGVFGSTTLANLTLGSDAENQAQNVWIRVVALTASTGSNSRDTFGIDNVSLTYSNVNASVPPTAPAITADPVSRTNAVLTAATFSVAATGTAPLFYQWFRNGVALTNGSKFSGVTTDTLSVTNVLHADAGSYRVVVTNAAAALNVVTSTPADLTVVGFAIAPIAKTNVLAGNVLSLGLTFIDNQSPVTVLTAVSSNQNIVSDANLGGVSGGSSGTLTVAPVSGAAGVARIYVTAGDGTFATNASFPLLVVPSSDVLFNDQFDYADGVTTTNSLGMWSNHSGPAGESVVTNGQVRVSRSETEDINARLIGAPLSTNAGSVVYSRFRVSFTSAPAAGGNYFAHFKDDTTVGQVGRVWASTANAASGFRLGIGNANTSTVNSGQFPLDLALNQTNTVVTRLDLATGQSTIWLNPASEGDLSVTATDAVTNLVAVTAFALRQDSSEGIMWVDDLVIAKTFAAALGGPVAIPLNIHISGGDAILTWTNAAFQLQAAPSVTGTFTNITGAVSPHPVPLDQPQRFFRLQFP